jgi:ribonuclease G
VIPFRCDRSAPPVVEAGRHNASRGARYRGAPKPKGNYVPTEILISSDPWENRVAIREDGHLAEIYFEREEKVIGSIYKGKVMNVLPGMGASFVDIGLGRNAFLFVDDINKTPLNIGDVEITQGRSGWTITEKISKGDDVLVQIVKEPRGLKGARISTNISLPGRYLILMPTGKYSGVSRKIESADERNRLKGIMKMIRPDGMATVIRTAAAGVSQAELIADLGVLIRMWHGILESYKRAPAPSLIHKDINLVFKTARDFITPEVERVLLDNAEDYEKVRDFMRLLGPQYVDRIEYYNGGRSLFKDYKIDEEVEKLLRPKINLPSGGSIVIETTEALTVIDVNSGKFTGGKNSEDTFVRTNIEAAAEIARQVRLRDIGGIIVCDFIDMSTENARNRVISTLEAGLQKDRTRTTIQSFSALGLLEFTRKRVGKDLSAQLRGPCPTCNGLGSVMSPESVAIQTFRDVQRFGQLHHNGAAHKPIEVVAAPTVGAQIAYWYENELEGLEKELETTIAVRVDPALHPEKFRIEELADQAAAVAPPPNVRVGDELEVNLVHTRMPVETSALAIVGDRLVEVENAASAAGETLKIKIIDIDEDGTILAEPRANVVQLAAEVKKRRRRGGRGRKKELTLAEQDEQLRELAEEAAKGVGARPALGISTTAEAEAEDAEVRAHTASTPPIATVTPLHAVPEYAAVDPNGEGRTYASYGGPADGEGRRRRRRRRRRRGGPAEAANGVASSLTAVPDGSPVSPLQAPAAGAEGDADLEGDDEEVSAAPSAGEEGQVRKRRRRRRRRGRGGLPTDAATAADAAPVPDGGRALPDRQIFRVNGAGAAEPTGETAPPEPVRAIAAVEHRRGAVAVEAPPPILTVPDTTAVTQIAKPARRRRKADDLESTQLALPSPAPEAPAPKKRGRPRKVVADAPAAVAAVAPLPDEAPKRRGRKPKADATAEVRATAVKAATAPAKPAAAKAKAPVRRAKAEAPAPARAAAATKAAPRGKKTTAKKAAASTSARKKTTTSRKKKSSS